MIVEAHLHPMLSSLPCALLSLALIAEFVAWRWPTSGAEKIVTWNLVAAVAGIVASFLSGYLAADFANLQLQIPEAAISYHHLWGKAVLIVAIVTLMLRFISAKAKFNRALFLNVFRFSLLVLWGMAVSTAYLGGDLLLRRNSPVLQSGPDPLTQTIP